MSDDLQTQLNNTIRTVSDWPEPGVQFRDITPILQNPAVFKAVIDHFCQRYSELKPDVLVCIDARGFLFASPVAYALGLPLVPIRKKGKLPYHTVSTDYSLEYGTGTIELHQDAIEQGQSVVLVDDLIATGGTLLASAKLVRELGGRVIEAAAIVDLPDLGGSQKLIDDNVKPYALTTYQGV
ncbi:MAG: adenine phosphoribosyltransferase [Gammaproteobacteria bacterium]|nr:adenine phosphoribosyltransferase [Gammaproteobacteria bacterium]